MSKNYIYFFITIFIISCFTPERDCKKFHYGNFSFQTIVLGDTITTNFTRVDDIEIDYFSKIPDTSSVKWISECECIVKKKNPVNFQDSKAIQIKIISTSANSYTFEYNLVGDISNKQRGVVTKISD